LATELFISGGNPSGILARSWQDSQRDPAANLARILARKQKSLPPKSWRDPAVNLAKILAGKQKSLGPKSRQDANPNHAKILRKKKLFSIHIEASLM